VGKNQAEFSQWKDFSQEYNQKEINWETLNNYNPNSNHNNLTTILTVGASLVLAGGLIIYFLTRRKNKK
jgi:LPXTG-motif cell wall-anchored protein